MDDILIWWTSQINCKHMGENMPEDAPEYLKKEYRSRLGRNGRCRLWVAKEFGEVNIDPWPETPVTKILEDRSCAGIVIHAKDATFCISGLITTLNLEQR